MSDKKAKSSSTATRPYSQRAAGDKTQSEIDKKLRKLVRLLARRDAERDFARERAKDIPK